MAKKTDLLNIAEHYALTSVKHSMLKYEINNILIKFLVDEEILDESTSSSVLVTQTDLQLRELEIQREIQMEKIKIRTGRKNKSRAVGKRRTNAEGKIRNGGQREGERKTNSERKVGNGRTNSNRKIRTGRKRKRETI